MNQYLDAEIRLDTIVRTTTKDFINEHPFKPEEQTLMGYADELCNYTGDVIYELDQNKTMPNPHFPYPYQMAILILKYGELTEDEIRDEVMSLYHHPYIIFDRTAWIRNQIRDIICVVHDDYCFETLMWMRKLIEENSEKGA